MKVRFAVKLSLLVLPYCCGCGAFQTDSGIFPLPTGHLVYPLPIMLGVQYEDVTFLNPGGETLHGWWIPADGATTTILIHHGALGNRSSFYPHYTFLHSLGYHVFIYDYQGFGENNAIASLDTLLGDANAALNYLRARPEDSAKRIVSFGLSMGTMPAIAQASTNPPDILAVVLEGLVQKNINPFGFLSLGIDPSPEAFSHIPEMLDPYTHVPLITATKLFISELQDDITPFSGSMDLYNLAIEPKQFLSVLGQHLDGVNVDPVYLLSVKAFLQDATAEPNVGNRG